VTFWNKLLGRAESAAPPEALPRPDGVVYVVGDIHGRRDLLDRALALVAADRPGLLVLVGDYIDRGPDSCGVLERLRGLPGAVCLRGNHEAMLLEFLDDPKAYGPRWLRNGGDATLASFGLATGRAEGPALVALRDALRAAMGAELETWLRARPLIWQSGNLVVVHGAADPALPIDEQTEQVLLWGHPAFLRQARADGLWVAHGHTIVEKPYFGNSRIAVDTGACFTGRLTVAVIEPEGDVRFLAT